MTIDRFKEILQCCTDWYSPYDNPEGHEALTKLINGIDTDDILKHKIYQIIKDVK